MYVHHCPRCELRFSNEADVKDHLINDHSVEPETLKERLPGWTRDHEERRDAPDLMHPDPNRT